MKLTILEKSIFMTELNFANNISKNLFLSVTSENIILYASNEECVYAKELSLETVDGENLKTVYEIVAPGAFALPEEITTILKGLGKKVELELKESVLHIESSGIKAQLPIEKETVQPSIPELTVGKSLNAPKTLYNNLIERAGHAVGTSDSRPILKGLLMQGTNNSFKVVSTDAHRVAMIEANLNIELPAIVIPSKLFALALKVFNEEEKITLAEGGTWCLLQQEETRVYIRLIDGTYPNVEALIQPPDNAIIIDCAYDDFIQAINRTLPFSKGASKPLFNLLITKDGVSIESRGETGNIISPLAATISNFESDMKVCINSEFMKSALSAQKSRVKVHVVDPLRPVYIFGEVPGNTQMVLPTRTS